VTASLAFRKNEAAICRGDVPEKYTRLLPYIPGDRILEVGSAEGVLSLMLAREDGGNKRLVIGLEKSHERHEAALDLSRDWAGFRFSAMPVFVHGHIAANLDLLARVDTLVAVRMIYYLRDQLDTVFAGVAKQVENVVLCGNRNRANRWRCGVPDELGGPANFYASSEGMRELLLRHGYQITEEVTDGDEIVVGRMV
jgi:hypothetical protein